MANKLEQLQVLINDIDNEAFNKWANNYISEGDIKGLINYCFGAAAFADDSYQSKLKQIVHLII